MTITGRRFSTTRTSLIALPPRAVPTLAMRTLAVTPVAWIAIPPALALMAELWAAASSVVVATSRGVSSFPADGGNGLRLVSNPDVRQVGVQGGFRGWFVLLSFVAFGYTPIST